MTSIGRRIVSGAAWAAVDTWARSVIVLVIFIVLARLLTPQELGLATLALVTSSILAIPVTQGIPEAIIQRREIESLHLDSAFWLLLLTGVLLGAVVWALAGPIAAAFGEPIIAELVRWTSLVIIIRSLVAVPEAVLKRNLEFRLFALRTMMGAIAGGAVGIGMALKGFGAWSIIGMHLVGSIVEALVIFVRGMWQPGLRFSYGHCRQLFGFAGPIMGQSILVSVNDMIPKVVLGTFIGPSAVGMYAVARKPLDTLATILLTPLNAIAMPAVSRLQDDPSRISRFFDFTVRLSGLVGIPAFVGFAAIAPIAVPLVFGEQWTQTVLACQIFMFLGLIRTVDGPCANTILALGYSGLLLKFHIVYAIIGTVLFTIAANISLEATVIAILIINFILLIIFLYFTKRLADVQVSKPLAVFPRLAVAALLMFAAVSGWLHAAPHDMPRAIIVVCGVGVGAIVYGAFTLLLARSDLINVWNTTLMLRGQNSRLAASIAKR